MTLKVQTSNGTLRMKVSPRINWLILFSALLVLLIITGVGLIPALGLLHAALQTGDAIAESIFKLLVFAALAVANIYAVLKMLFASDVILLNQTTLEIQRWLFNIVISRRSFPNSTVENLRYDEWSGGKAGTQNAVRFESVGETVAFARQATDSDSWDLIDKMCEVYKFPTKENSAEPERNPAVTNW